MLSVSRSRPLEERDYFSVFAAFEPFQSMLDVFVLAELAGPRAVGKLARHMLDVPTSSVERDLLTVGLQVAVFAGTITSQLGSRESPDERGNRGRCRQRPGPVPVLAIGAEG